MPGARATVAAALVAAAARPAAAAAAWRLSANVTMPPDAGQPLGTLFEVTDATGAVVAHAGAAHWSGTYLSNQNRELVFHVALPDAPAAEWADLGAPFPEVWTETRCTTDAAGLVAFNRDIGARNVARPGAGGGWERGDATADLPTWQGALATCGGALSFGETAVRFGGREVFRVDTSLFAAMYTSYAYGRMLVYAMTRDATKAQNRIIVGEWACGAESVRVAAEYDDPTSAAEQPHNFPYTWLALPGGAFLIGTNLGEVYRVSDAAFETLRRWTPGVSWQPYTFIQYFDRVLLGQYPTGGVFEVGAAGRGNLSFPADNVGVEASAGSGHRELQQLAIYGDELLAGVWPWGTVWGRSAREAGGGWSLRHRLFTTPAVSAEDAPWVGYIQNRTGEYHNGWGQRVEGACLSNGSLYLTTSAKNYGDVQAARDLIPPAARAEYGRVWRVSRPGQVSGHFEWRRGTRLTFDVTPAGIDVRQDGAPLASARFPSPLQLPARAPFAAAPCAGIFGPCAAGVHVDVSVDPRP